MKLTSFKLNFFSSINKKIHILSGQTSIALQFKKLFEFITKEWEKFELNNQFHVLEEITIKGSKMAQLYRSK